MFRVKSQQEIWKQKVLLAFFAFFCKFWYIGVMFTLNIEARNVFGKKLKEHRKEGKIPAVLYGKGEENKSLFIDFKEFNKIWKKAEESTVITLKNPSDSKFSKDVLIYDAAIDPLKNEPIHVDFYALEAGKSITANVNINFEGISPAVKELGAVLVKVVHELEIEALPKDFPHEIKVSVSKLVNIGDKILVKDIIMPPGVKVLAKADAALVLVKAHEEEKEPEKEMSIEDIEVEKKGKKEEATEAEVEEGAKEIKKETKEMKGAKEAKEVKK
mgnify:CR=1 FL=1